jgi:putative FmdB family regulatory protein
MPIYDYSCRACNHEFEALVRGSSVPACPECRSEELDRKVSFPVVKSESTKGRIMASAKKRDKLQAIDRAHEQRKYELSHDD